MVGSNLKIVTAMMVVGMACNGIGTTVISSTTNAQETPAVPVAPPKDADIKGSGNDDGKPVAKKTDDNLDKNTMFPDGRIHDFGRVSRGTQCKHVFRVVNTSSGDSFRIVSVRSNACAFPAYPQYIGRLNLNSKEEGKLEITLDTRRFIGPRCGRIWLVVDTGGRYQEFIFSIQADAVELELVRLEK